MNEFLDMGGYGKYLWPAFALGFYMALFVVFGFDFLAGMVASAQAGLTPEAAFSAAESRQADTTSTIPAPAKKQATRIRKADMPDAAF